VRLARLWLWLLQLRLWLCCEADLLVKLNQFWKNVWQNRFS
jgi:hypothetical protein